MIDKKFEVKKRRAISTIIGTFFFLVLMVGTFTAILTVLAFQNDLIKDQSAITELNIKRNQESFSIQPFTTGSGAYTLGVDVNNKGTNQVEIVDVWVIEKGDDYDANMTRVSYVDAFVPLGSKKNVLASQSPPITLNSGQYVIKAVSSLGNMVAEEMNAPSLRLKENVLKDTLAAKPAVYTAFPNPFGKGGDDGTGYWAIIVTNPTNLPMGVNQTSIQLIAPDDEDAFEDDDQFEHLSPKNFYGAVTYDNPPPGNPFPVTYPAGDLIGKWSLEEDQVVFWKDINNKLIIPPYSAINFTMRIQGADSTDTPIVTMSANAYTSFGQFGFVKYTLGTLKDDDTPVPNIYLSSTSAGSDNDKKWVVLGARSGLPKTYNFTIHNSGDGQIDAGSYLVINVPKDFGPVSPSVGTKQGDLTLASNNIMYDGSHQLLVHLGTDIQKEGGDYCDEGIGNPGDLKRTFAFTTTSPTVTDTTLYVFYAYAIGSVTDCNPITHIMGPVAEIVVQVIT